MREEKLVDFTVGVGKAVVALGGHLHCKTIPTQALQADSRTESIVRDVRDVRDVGACSGLAS